MNLLSHIRNQPVRAHAPLDFDEWVSWFGYNGVNYPALQTTASAVPQREIQPELYGFSEMALKRNGIVFACVNTRMRLFSEARFKFRPRRSVGSGDNFGGSGLSILEQPWQGATTADLLARISLDVDMAGNAYVYRRDRNTLRIARPDWVTSVMASTRADGRIGDIDTELVGYIYRPPAADPMWLERNNMAHIFPAPDPLFPWRGMSWLQPVIREVMSDGAATEHKLNYFEQRATPNLKVKFDTGNAEDFQQLVDVFQREHEGSRNAYKTLFLNSGADAEVIGANLRDVEFKATQAHGETRIANAAGIHPVVLGITAGLDASTYTNFPFARRHFADGTMRPFWRITCNKLEQLLETTGNPPELPPGAGLWYEDRDIPWLADDAKDSANVMQVQAATIASLITAGFQADAAVAAVTAGDFSNLEHTGLVSVQLLPPGVPSSQPASQNGNGNQLPVPASGRP